MPLLLKQTLLSRYGNINDIFIAFFYLKLPGCSLHLVNYTWSPFLYSLFPYCQNTML